MDFKWVSVSFILTSKHMLSMHASGRVIYFQLSFLFLATMFSEFHSTFPR